MRKRNFSRQGLAAVEFALLLPGFALLLFLIIEGANAMHTYSSLVEASREGARLALMDGETSEIETLVRAITDDLNSEALRTSVTTDTASNTVTVEVSYDYQPFGEYAIEMLTGEDSLTLAAQTTMPLP
ncbi:TadE/TadG family type IV pilus assembly protein [Pseudodesulfovibrio piezophilus]|uniref:TadE family protein n=1 Tax=Pseudodesulfovibrio piezophilus (strain DSM 21447 / JCM 15486 / C1TLV30) TaxID=1322246 RepID=M1WJY3_PSEP2|nr:TadE/TadG family type IV pilus assembly protein [Pseudodesulfovibrio piezophilus]CCH48686.1 TadE family protein [Pseudodesulfovibrio piezophilus C1TLV30]